MNNTYFYENITKYYVNDTYFYVNDTNLYKYLKNTILQTGRLEAEDSCTACPVASSSGRYVLLTGT